jgi:hypothetical protein
VIRLHAVRRAAARIKSALIAGVAVSPLAFAELPPDLPGEELSHEQLDLTLPRDTVKRELAVTPKGTGLPWLDKAQKTWDAPPLAEQMASGDNFIPIGKGGIFIPRFSSEGTSPDINIRDAKGRLVATGNAGSTFKVEPGMYTVILGSGAHKQRIIRAVNVEEGKTTPIIPEWSGLTVETVDSMAIPFRGEYELVRIDEFETYGRGFGANPDLGGVVKTWVLKPGTYKILGIGQGFNSLTNFVTVRLVQGELCKVLLVQDTLTNRILGGGTVEVTPRTSITSHWKYGANIGGNVKFNAKVDPKDTTFSTTVGLLSTLWLTYNQKPYEWQTRVRLDEGFKLSGLKIGNLESDADDFQIISLFIWRILSWFGPYGQVKLRTNFLSERKVLGDDLSYFCILSPDYYINNPATHFDSSHAFTIKPPFAPLLLDAGIGANADVFNFTFLETKIRAGLGNSFSYLPARYSEKKLEVILPPDLLRDSTFQPLFEKLAKSMILYHEDETSMYNFGPQFSIYGMLRLGRVITADGDLIILAPVAPEQRLMRPDFDLIANISWRISRWITADYSYTLLLQQPENEAARIDKSTHGIWLRFSFTSR